MLELNLLEQIIADQRQNFEAKDPGIEREIDFLKYQKTPQITVISGIRRSGKSTLLKQFSGRFSPYYYLTFDDERLINFSVEDFATLMLAFSKVASAKAIFLDEIQNVSGWERFVRRLHEEGYKIFITGSNAKLLSSELATHLTGRYFKIDLFPFSFREFLRFNAVNLGDKTTKTQALILKHFDDYLTHGGFPEYVKYKDKEFITRAYEDVIFKDIITRFKIRASTSFQQMASYLFTNIGKEISYNSLKNILDYKSVISVKKHVGYLAEAFLLFELYKYDYSLKKQFRSNKKIYAIDTGMRNEIAFSFSKDSGRLLENVIYIELKRRGQEVFYFKGKQECDFLVKEKNKIRFALQVTTVLTEDNTERELNGLVEATLSSGINSALVITLNQEKKIKRQGIHITIIPAWKWLTSSTV
ncbi:MAG: ATP-binding protein [Candidatus Magasanikbacteria bacterium]|nr:ATP-binding protein [Candidatus Magasanikbacteria bacterium]